MKGGHARYAAVWAVSLACIAACGEQGSGWQPGNPDFTSFVDEALPVLLRDCGFHTCHGSPERFFRVWGPGRMRLHPTTREFDLVTTAEWQASYQLAASMIDPRNPEQSPLLRKPLSLAAGGTAHRGADSFGRNVYRSTEDEGYRALRAWVLTHRNTGAMQRGNE